MYRKDYPCTLSAIRLTELVLLVLCFIALEPLIYSDGWATPFQSQHPALKAVPINAPFAVSAYYFPSGWMGDGTRGEKYVQIDDSYRNKPRPKDPDGLCIQVRYNPGEVGWAGIYWQYPPKNWGEQVGKQVRGAHKIVFWAAGERGNEVVEFKAGGIRDNTKPYRDSFEVSLGPKRLTHNWMRYEIDLKGQDLSSVVGAFAWIAKAGENPNGLTFYLDDIRYE